MSSIPAPLPVSLDTALGALLDGQIDDILTTLREGITQIGEADLDSAVSRLLGVAALATGAAFAGLTEAESRGVIAASTAAGTASWIRARARDAGVPMTPSVAKTFATVADATRTPGMADLKDATSKGQISLAGAAVVAREFRTLRHKIDPTGHDGVLSSLIDYAAGGATTRQLAELCDMTLSQYGLVTTFQDDCDRRRDRTAFTGFARDRHGTYTAKVTLDPTAHAIVEAAITALSAPTPAQDGFIDFRSPDTRRADALIELCSVIAPTPTSSTAAPTPRRTHNPAAQRGPRSS